MISVIRRLFKMKHINLIHVFIIGLLLTLVGVLKQKTPNYLWNSFYILVLLIPIMVGFPKLSLSYWSIIQLMHYLIFLPLFIYIGYKRKFNKNSYSIMVGSGLMIIVYHLYKFFTRINS